MLVTMTSASPMARLTRAGAATLLALLLVGCGAEDTETDASAESTPSETTDEEPGETATEEPADGQAEGDDAEPASAPGQYLELAEYQSDTAVAEGTDVVLFFHATWCPDCQEAEKSLTSEGVPDGLTVVKVDFDSETDLRQQYGVTVQHTFVQVDGKKEIKKWTGSASGAEIAGQLA